MLLFGFCLVCHFSLYFWYLVDICRVEREGLLHPDQIYKFIFPENPKSGLEVSKGNGGFDSFKDLGFKSSLN